MSQAIKFIGVAFLVVLLLASASHSSEYQGFGAETPGGSGQPVYRVTNLNDSGPGSLRDAVSRGNRYVVFDVAGNIVLSSMIKTRGAFLTIDGFTAPDPGITLVNYGIHIDGDNGNHDIIVRGIRVRNSALDGITVKDGAYNVVIDHVSIQGSADGNLDITMGAHDVTVSWSILAEPYDPVKDTDKNMLIKYNPSRITLHHNIFLKSKGRNPQVRIDDVGTPATDTTVDMRNNLVWDWKDGEGTLIWYGPRANVVNNFYSSPSSSSSGKKKALIVGKQSSVYASGNFSADGINVDAAGNRTEPFSAPAVDTQDALAAACVVVAEAGVRPLDAVDQQHLSEISLPPCGVISSNDPPAPSSDPNTSCQSSNLALCATASASSIWSSSYDAAKSNDGNGSTRWNSADGETAGAWLALDFGSPINFDTVVLSEAFDRITGYSLQYWDGAEWSNIVSGTTIGSRKTFSFPVLTSERVRLVVTNTVSSDSSGTPTIYEFEVY